MRIDRLCLSVVFACSIAFAGGCNKADSQVSSAEQQKVMAQQKQVGIDSRISQINNSNLSPEEKQRLIDQVRASGGK